MTWTWVRIPTFWFETNPVLPQAVPNGAAMIEPNELITLAVTVGRRLSDGTVDDDTDGDDGDDDEQQGGLLHLCHDLWRLKPIQNRGSLLKQRRDRSETKKTEDFIFRSELDFFVYPRPAYGNADINDDDDGDDDNCDGDVSTTDKRNDGKN